MPRGHSKAPIAARRDSVCVQIPAQPNQWRFNLSHVRPDAGSEQPFDLLTHRELYCRWYVQIGSGYKACKAFPSPAAPCHTALKASKLLPSHSEVEEALQIIKTKSLLIIGDSTMLNKYIFLRFIGVRSSCKSGPGVCFLPTYGLAGCCNHPLWDLQTKRTDYDVVWWSNGGLHYLHSGERYDKKADGGLPGVLGASLTSYLNELHNCSKHLRQRYSKALHIYKLSNWVCSDAFNGPWRENLHRYVRSPESPKFTLGFNEIGAIALNAAERELGRNGPDGKNDDHGLPAYTGRYDLGQMGPMHVLQDSLTSGMCACSCDGVHFPLIMPALIVQLAAKIGRLLNASGSSSRRLAETPLPPPYGFAASERFDSRTLEWTGYARRPAKQQLVCK